jgi:hypothetical protein
MNYFEYDFHEPRLQTNRDKPQAVRLYQNNSPIDEEDEEAKQS